MSSDESKMKKKKKMPKLQELYDERIKTDKRKSISLWYYHYNKYIWRIGLLILFLGGFPTLLILILLYFGFPVDLEITISLVVSLVAFLISITTLLLNIIRIMDYPIDNLSIEKLKSEDTFYELQFSVKNCGHGKLKLDFAMYFIEGLKPNDSKNTQQNSKIALENTAVTSFLYYNHETFSKYLEDILARITNGDIKDFYLQEITTYAGIYITHDDEHVERRIHKLEQNKLYSITFLFRTTHKVWWYTSKHIQT